MKDAFKKILFATDLSETSRHALRYAMDLAEKYQGQITMLHILPDMIDEYSINTGLDLEAHFDKKNLEEINKKGLKSAQEALHKRIIEMSREAREELGHSPIDDDHVIIKIGKAEKVILDEVNQGEYDLLIMGSHGQGKIKDLFIGSVAEAVVHKCTIPVLVVRLPS